MPVQLNEPLNTLQRLCEELEYSSLLDQASRMADPCERMVPTQGHLFLLGFCLSSQAPAGWVPDVGALHPSPGLCLRRATVPIPGLLYLRHSAWPAHRCTSQPLLSLPTPPRTTGRDASPSTRSWERPTSVSGLTGVSVLSASRCGPRGGRTISRVGPGRAWAVETRKWASGASARRRAGSSGPRLGTC